MIAFLFIVAVSYAAIASTTIKLVGNYQLEQRMRNDRYSAEKIAVSVTPLFLVGDISNLSINLDRYADEYNVRLMILDKYGKVQVDTYGLSEGMRLDIAEVAGVINGEYQTGYGIYDLHKNNSDLSFKNANYINICTTGLIGINGMQGSLLYLSSLDGVMNNLHNLKLTIAKFFIAAAILSLLCAMLFSSIITRPVASLTNDIKKMAEGDFSIRVKESGSREIKNLAATFNNMCQKLENLEKSRNQFVSNASHELKTPLATMKILLENVILQEDMERGLVVEFLSDINMEIDRLNLVVKDLLTLVSLDNKTLSIDKSNFSYSNLVDNISRKMALLASQKNQTLHIDVEEDCNIIGDSSRLHHVIYNLIDNAIKYTPEGGVIEVSLHKNGKFAVFSVQDNGPGIPSEDIKSIFDRFYRVDKARSRETGGTGLGLSIVYQIVMLHQGKIYVNSQVDEGSEFVVEIPIGIPS